MLLADTHLLGPHNGHWFDKLRREWQMHRAFQTSVWLYQPDVIFILGDIFDEGQWVDEDSFKAYVRRFNQLFHTPSHIQVFSAAGNHDIGFHYRFDIMLYLHYDYLPIILIQFHTDCIRIYRSVFEMRSMKVTIR